VTDDRQTDHATEKWVAIGNIAFARAISHKLNYYNTDFSAYYRDGRFG